MTNAFIRNRFTVLAAILVMALALFVGAFAGTAHADCASDGNCGYDEIYSPSPSYVDSIDWSYEADSPSYVDSIDWSYEADTPSYVDSIDWSYEADSPSYVDSIDWSYAPDYVSPTPTYYAPTYGSTMPSYVYSAIPTVARPYVPSYVYSPSYTSAPTRQPTYTVATTPTNNTNVNNNDNNNTSVNTNTNVASVGDIINNVAPIINVNTGPSHRPVDYEFPRPVCTMYASSNYGPITLTWTSQNATTAFISPNVGNVAVNGAVTVYPQGYTTYTLTVTGAGGSATCQAVASYAPSYTVVPPPPAPAPAPYVSLSQIPYTGFDYGPVGNAIYWGALSSFAAAAGYLLVYGMPKLALAGAFTRGNLGRAGKNNPYDTKEVAEVFKQNIVASTDLSPEATPEAERSVNASVLPVATSSHAGLTSDAMILDRSANGAPRIVIARG